MAVLLNVNTRHWNALWCSSGAALWRAGSSVAWPPNSALPQPFLPSFPQSRTLISGLGRKHSCRGRSGRGLPPCVQIFFTLVLASPLLPPSTYARSSASGLFLWERDPESLQGWGQISHPQRMMGSGMGAPLLLKWVFTQFPRLLNPPATCRLGLAGGRWAGWPVPPQALGFVGLPRPPWWHL